MNLKSLPILFSTLGLMSLVACSGSQTATQSPTQSPATSQPTSIATSSPKAIGSGVSNQAGMVVEVGPYHFELMPEKKGNETHLDLFLQKGDNHEAIPNAKVTAQVQLPDGTQKSIAMIYDASGKHYAGTLETAATGEYKVAVQSEINGEKANARYTFKQ